MATATEDQVQADPTMRAVDRFADESQWQIVRGRPVFTEHDEFEKDRQSPDYGKLKRHFGEKELQAIADKCNRRYETTGDACPLTLGHTLPGKPEEEQPPICGFAINFRLGHFGPEQKLAILCDWYLFPELELHNGTGTGVLDQHPRCSVELYPNDEVFDPIALLRRTPELDMGLTIYQKQQETAAIYQRLEREHRRRYIHKFFGPVIRYAMGEEAMADDMGAAQAAAPAAPDQADMFARHFACSDKVMDHFRKKYESTDGSEKTESPDLTLDQEEKFSKYGRYVAKHSKAYKKAAKRYQDETGEKLDDSEQYGADEMSDDEKKEATAFSKHFAKSKLMKYAMGDEEEPAAPAVGGDVAAATPAAPEVEVEVNNPEPVAGANPEGESEDYGKDDAGELPPVHANTAERYFKHLVRKGHVKRYIDQHMKQHYSAAAAAGGSNTFTPSGPEGAGTPVPGGNKPEQFQKDKTMSTAANDPALIQYAKRIQALEAKDAEREKRVKALEDENNKLRYEKAHSEGQRCVIQLEGEGYSFGDVTTEEGLKERNTHVERFAKASPEAREQMKGEIRSKWKQEGPPTGGPQFRIAPDADPVARNDVRPGGAQPFGKREMDQAMQYSKEHPEESWENCVKKFTRRPA